MSPRPDNTISLEQLREGLDGEALSELLSRSGGQMLVNLPIGAGKSSAADKLIMAATKRYGLTIALFPTRRLIDERELIRKPRRRPRVVNLRPRPSGDCGADRDRRWRSYETRGLGTLGRVQVCRECPKLGRCFWPGQYAADNLGGARVVFGTQVHLERNPLFVEQMRNATKAEGKVLVVLDESGFVMSRLRRDIPRRQIEMYVSTLRSFRFGGFHRQLVFECETLLAAGTRDMRRSDWRMWRPPRAQRWELKIQQKGQAMFENEFHDIGQALAMFAKSPLASRERSDGGTVSFAVMPFFDADVVVFSGTSNPEFIKHRIGLDLPNPFAGTRIMHGGTRWFNIASRIGMRKHFPGNAPQLYDFFAGLIAKRLSDGKRPMVIVKKTFKKWCIAELQERLVQLGHDDAVVVDGSSHDVDLDTSKVVPVINFGEIGTNRYESFDAAYCVSGYYCSTRDVEDLLQETRATTHRIPLRLWTEGVPPRRRAGAANEADRIYDAHGLADLARIELEDVVVLQSVGRVRPYTKPREVITFAASDLGVGYDREFTSLAEARRFFGIPGRRESQRNATASTVTEAKAQGMTQRQTAEIAGVSVRTVRRYWSE